MKYTCESDCCHVVYRLPAERGKPWFVSLNGTAYNSVTALARAIGRSDKTVLRRLQSQWCLLSNLRDENPGGRPQAPDREAERQELARKFLRLARPGRVPSDAVHGPVASKEG